MTLSLITLWDGDDGGKPESRDNPLKRERTNNKYNSHNYDPESRK
jgi:hypothetical protein